MHKFLSLLFLLSGTVVNGQVTADPATGQMDITNLAGSSVSANFIAPETVVQLKVPVYNLNQLNALPAGSSKITIDLGNLLVLNPGFNLSGAPLNTYFNWTSALVGGSLVITGNLIAALPGDFTGIAEFDVKGPALGTSEIFTQFEITNPSLLTDEDLFNNTSTLQYTITDLPIPVTFTSITATSSRCEIDIRFSTENEINVKYYEIEAGTDGINFEKMGAMPAANSINYYFSFPYKKAWGTPVFIRVRSLDHDGKFKFSEVRSLKLNCDRTGLVRFNAIPNLVNGNYNVLIRTSDATLLNGNFSLCLYDNKGSLVKRLDMLLHNSQQFTYDPGILHAGNYYLKILSSDGLVSGTVPIIKL
ncbi:MAG: hypothetical protein WCI49_08130 [Ferruginibacter sp.]